MIIGDANGVHMLNGSSEAIGVHRRMKPNICEVVLEPGTTVVVFTDGVLNAGVRTGRKFGVEQFVSERLSDAEIGAQSLADGILSCAVELDSGRPNDDTSVLVARVVPRATQDEARRLSVRFPLE